MASTLTHLPPLPRTVLDEHEIARVEARTVRTSLSPESARLVRIERIIRVLPNPADQARARGFYDFMLGRPNQAASQGLRLAVSYEQGWAKGQQRRVALNGRAWYETEKTRSDGRWAWGIYREGYYQTGGNAPRETHADQLIEDSKADLMDHYGDWGSSNWPPAEHVEVDEAPGHRM